MKFDRDKMYEEAYDNDDVWIAFVEQWIQKHPDAVDEIISNHLENEMNEPSSEIVTEYSDFVYEYIDGEIEDYYEKKVEEMKEGEMLRRMEERK